MENYRIYKGVSQCALVGIVIVSMIAICNNDLSFMFLLALIQMPLALYQHLVGIHFVTSKRSRPEYVQSGFRVYWLLSFGYWIGLYVLTRFPELDSSIVNIYLFVISWPIPIYQYWLVQKSYSSRLSATNNLIES